MKTLKLLLCIGRTAMPLFKVNFSGTTTRIIVCLLLLKMTSATAMWKSKPEYESSNSSLLLSTVTVGSGGNYATLKTAFDAINAGTITGAVTLQIISSTTETAMVTLNASGVGLANYSAVLIYATGSGYTVSGNIANPLLNLNGADNVTIDGRVNASGATADLVFSNSSTGISACALRLINSAKNNTIKYNTLTASGLSLGTAIVNFSSATTGNGNDNNTVEYCKLTNTAGNRPYNAILSVGTAGRENSGNIIRNNILYNFMNETNNSYGVNVSIYSTDWNISNNSFYDTGSLVPTGSYSYGGIRVATPNMHTVTGNYIGGSQPLCGGTPLTMNSSFATYFGAIVVTGNTTTPTLIQNNTIQNINYSSTSANPWDGLYLSAGNVTFSGNTIGTTTGTNSIVLTTPNATVTAAITGGVVTALNLIGGGSGFTTAPTISFTPSGSTTSATATATISGGVITGFTIVDGGSGYTSIPNVNINGAGYSTSHGIRCLNSGTVLIENNSIGSITTFGNTAYSHCFEGMVISGFTTSVITVNNNLIGSLTTANSIKTSSSANASVFKQDLRGIYINSNINLATITGNTIANTTSAYTGSSLSKADGIYSSADNNVIQNNTIRDITANTNTVTVRGIQQIVSVTGTNQSITGNTVYNLSNTHPTATVTVVGIDYTGPTSGTNVISGNFVHSLSLASSSTLSQIVGIILGNGATTVANNIVNLGTGVGTGYTIYGIYDNSSPSTANANNIYFNSVYIAGTVASTATSTTAALWNASSTSIRNYRNNVLVNLRTGGTTGKHYVIRVAGSSGLTIDYNDYYAIGGTFLGLFNSGADKTTLAAWKTATGQDANSLNTNPLFTTAGGTNPLNYYTSAILNAATGTGIINDYTGLSRSVTPKMGALEITAYVWSGAASTDFATAANWQNGLVPPNGSDISFAVSPLRHCVLDQNRTLRNITNAQAIYQLLLNGKELTLTGNLAFSNNAKIDATAAASIILFGGTAAQNIPAGALVSNTMDGLTLNNTAGLTLNDNIAIAHPLTLTVGALTIGAHTLTLNGILNIATGTLIGGNSSNIVIGGGGTINLPAVTLNNLTVNRTTGITMAGSVSVTGALALTDGIISVEANTLTLSGSSPTRVNGAVDASHPNAIIAFTNTSAIILPIAFFATAVNNLTVNGVGGITSADDFTINGTLDLVSNNPSATKGTLDMLSGTTLKTLTMGANASNSGHGDTTGIVKRTTIAPGGIYTFGNPFMKVYFTNTGTLPSQVSLKIIIGTTPSWNSGAINRDVEVIQTGAVETSCVVTYHYLDTELNGNDEDHLVLWVKIGNIEYGASAFNATENWVALSNVNLAFFNATFDGTRNVTLDEYSTTNTLTWNGSLSTSWTSIQNWTPNVGPSSTKNIIIPDAATTANTPLLPSVTDINSLTIETGGVLNAVASAQLTLEGTNAWSNYGGTFNPNTSNIIFNNAIGTISGTTNFYDVTINSGKKLSMTQDSTMRIAGTITNNGVWKTIVSGPSTVEYNGAAQTIVNPNGTTAGYSNLILSGSGTKTLSSGLNYINGNFILSGTARTTANSGLTIDDNMIIGNSNVFNSGSFNHSIHGDFDNSGTFNATSGYGITFDGAVPQAILGSASTIFAQLTINNINNVNVYSPITIDNALTLATGILNLNDTNLKISGAISKTSGYIATSNNAALTFSGTGDITLAGNLFNPAPSIRNLSIDRSGIVTLGQDMTISGILNLATGVLDINNSNLNLGSSGLIAVIAPDATKMIVADHNGKVFKTLVEGSSFTYPIGDHTGTAEYSPITLNIAGDDSPDIYFGVNVANAKHPNNASGSQYLNRYWNVSHLGIDTDQLSISATYTAADIVGTETNISSAGLTGTFNQSNNPWIKYNALTSHTLTTANITLAPNQSTAFTGIAAANPTVNILGAGTTTCVGSDVALGTTVTAEGTILYDWTPSYFLSSTTIANPMATAITATTAYTVTIKDGNGISTNATGTVSTGNTTTYTGTWDNGAPTATSAVVMAADYTATASLACCSLTVNSNAVVTIPSGMNVILNGALTVSSGSFTLENNANLLQNTNAANSGNIIVKRASSALIRQDYTLWSSPVTGQQLQAFSPSTLANRFYVYDSQTNVYAAHTPTVNFENAKGYLIRVPNNHPATATEWNGSFSGVPHNGDYPFAMSVGDATHRFNLVGNPYPSPIGMTQFVAENSNNITGTLYFWRKTNNAASPSYCSWTAGTFVSNGEAQVFNPYDIIRTGQGFIVEAKAAASSVLFANTQRVTDTANQFFRNTTIAEQHRIWLNATNTSGAFSQTEVGYVTDAVSELDAYDGKYLNDGAIGLYTLIDTQPLVIQGRALPFEATDIVPLGFKATTAGNYSIAIDHVDGLFDSAQPIYLKDLLTGVVQNLKINPYAFASELGTFDSRFEIGYTDFLSTPTITESNHQIIVYKNKDVLMIESGTALLTAIQIYDSRGRLLQDKDAINASSTSFQNLGAQGVLFVRITSTTGIVVMKKVLW